MRAKNAFLDIDLKLIRDLLGPDVALPELPPGPIGRFRLVQVLQNRFGQDFKTVGPARQVLRHFDKETKYVRGFLEAKMNLGGERE